MQEGIYQFVYEAGLTNGQAFMRVANGKIEGSMSNTGLIWGTYEGLKINVFIWMQNNKYFGIEKDEKKSKIQDLELYLKEKEYAEHQPGIKYQVSCKLFGCQTSLHFTKYDDLRPSSSEE